MNAKRYRAIGWGLALLLAGGWLTGGASAWATPIAVEKAGADGHQQSGAGTSHGAPDPLSFDPDLAVVTLIVFVVLLAVLWKFAWGPIAEALDKREHSIAHQIAEAQRMHDEAKQLLAEHERKLAGAADEMRAIIDEARRDAEHVRQEIVAEAKSSAEAERARALRDIDAAADAAIKSLAEHSANMAVDLAGKILSAKLSKDDHARLIQEAQARFAQRTPSAN